MCRELLQQTARGVDHRVEIHDLDAVLAADCDLRGRELQTEGGTKIGVIDHVILDEEARVWGFGLGKVYSQGPLAERRAVSRDAVLNLGSAKEPMTINLGQAESLAVPST